MPSPLSVWNTAPTSAPAQRKGRYVPGSAAHPAKMLPRIAAHAISTYTRPGELVLDPMCGIGTTLVEAIHLGRSALGVEYEAKWADLARLNAASATHEGGTGTGAVHCGDARRLTQLIPAALHGEVDLVVTSPPYGPSVHGQVRSSRETGERGVVKKDFRYSHDPANLAHVSTDRLLDAFTEILAQCRLMLRPGGTAVVTTRPWRERGELIDLPSAVLAAGRAAGLIPTERCVALLAGIRDSRLISRPSFFQMTNVRDARRQGIPLSVVQHEDVLVFTRPLNPPDCGAGSTRCATASARKPHTACTLRSRTCTTGRSHGHR
ncbi:site-specific DNA-methyltransferase [Streptomyces sp. ISL-22]|uniref:TRM11 family SAM-dependent methyltransferase n=1 Tax=unclassified Streptomyces TaxID=2593676 RepID=UPI001BE7F959|nr:MULTISPECIES: DNA methyltransferase [unclassified Streptomyces]MBT2418086.1 site-specific DNA-methyltransferase [Streptomyces sp. ISL-24]MBT2432239.1 site-specific DNA-methyltransferase [Streptomyces sp. ISL-22]